MLYFSHETEMQTVLDSFLTTAHRKAQSANRIRGFSQRITTPATILIYEVFVAWSKDRIFCLTNDYVIFLIKQPPREIEEKLIDLPV